MRANQSEIGLSPLEKEILQDIGQPLLDEEYNVRLALFFFSL
jgi:hypothetical protein